MFDLKCSQEMHVVFQVAAPWANATKSAVWQLRDQNEMYLINVILAPKARSEYLKIKPNHHHDSRILACAVELLMAGMLRGD